MITNDQINRFLWSTLVKKILLVLSIPFVIIGLFLYLCLMLVYRLGFSKNHPLYERCENKAEWP